MNERDAIDFLSQHQPMPDDDKLSEDLVARYDEVRRFLVENPSNEGVRLILSSFGKGDGWGVYQLVEDAVASVAPEVASGHLTYALRSPFESVKYWAAQISANYDDRRLIEPLRDLLCDSSEDVRMAAVLSIEKYMSEELKDELQSMCSREASAAIRGVITDIVNEAS
jgi:hypothetical protein